MRCVGFYSLFISILLFIGMPTLSGCPFILMELGIKMALMSGNKMFFVDLTAEAFLSPLDLPPIKSWGSFPSHTQTFPRPVSDSHSCSPWCSQPQPPRAFLSLTWHAPVVSWRSPWCGGGFWRGFCQQFRDPATAPSCPWACDGHSGPSLSPSSSLSLQLFFCSSQM